MKIPDKNYALKPAYKTPSPNEAIDLYTGELKIYQSDKILTTSGSIKFKWLPSPVVRFAIPETTDVLKKGPIRLEIPDYHTYCDAYVNNISITSSTNKSYQGILFRETILKKKSYCDNCDKTLFHLTNFKRYLGSSINENNFMWRGRLNLKNDEWEIIIDENGNAKDLDGNLRDQGGFALTHTGILRRSDGNKFNIEQAKDKLQALHYFLSFVRGFWCSPILEKGFLDDEISWEMWDAPHLTPWKSVSSWFFEFEPNSIEKTFKGFMDKWDNPNWKESMKTAIYWYVEANICAGGVEGAIILTQTALELLAWVYLVETANEPEYTISKFKHKPANNKICILLESMNIPTHIPKELTNVREFRKELRKTKSQKYNGIQIFTFIRNQIVHDRNDNPDKLSNIPIKVRIETRELGLWYLELVLLFLFGHNGDYYRRYVSGYPDEVKTYVPWVNNIY